jgi:hypothetical protein
MNTHTTNAAKTLGSYTLRHIRRTIEAEMLAAVANGVNMTQAHVGQLEMLAAVGAELDARGELLNPPPYVETDLEDGRIRLSYSVRVF